MTLSTYGRNHTLDLLYGSGTPATLYVQLHTGDPGATGVANVHTLGRAAVTNDATNWPVASGGLKQNGLKISWGSTAGQNSLPDATYASTWDSASGGNCLDYGAFASALPTADRVEVAILAGELSITRAA